MLSYIAPISVILLLATPTLGTASPCGAGWEPYKDEKCIKVTGKTFKQTADDWEEQLPFCRVSRRERPTVGSACGQTLAPPSRQLFA